MVQAWVVRDDDSSDEDSGIEDMESSHTKNKLTSLLHSGLHKVVSKPRSPVPSRWKVARSKAKLQNSNSNNTESPEIRKTGSESAKLPRRKVQSASIRRSGDLVVEDLTLPLRRVKSADGKRFKQQTSEDVKFESHLTVPDVSFLRSFDTLKNDFMPDQQTDDVQKKVRLQDPQTFDGHGLQVGNVVDSNKKLNETNEKEEPKKDLMARIVKTAQAVDKFKTKTRKYRFNFEKFLSFLENMRSEVGFRIAGIMVTWDLVSTMLFFLFSIIAVFLQESIFGSQDSLV